eukprot:365386-Chlamydomonas_euryale.AAC.9
MRAPGQTPRVLTRACPHLHYCGLVGLVPCKRHWQPWIRVEHVPADALVILQRLRRLARLRVREGDRGGFGVRDSAEPGGWVGATPCVREWTHCRA